MKPPPLSYEERLRIEEARAVLVESDQPVVDVLGSALPYQLEFIRHPAKRKAVCSTRRSAKTFCVVLYMLDTAIRTPGSKIAYLTLTNDSAETIVWGMIDRLAQQYGIQAELLGSKHLVRFGNGSVIYLAGLDATPKQMNRLRGNAYDLAVIDECQDFTQDLRAIVNDVLKMTLAQTGATLCMIGTPGNSLGDHYWWQINRPDSIETEWARFFFDWRNNTAVDPKSNRRVCDSIRDEVQRDLYRNPEIQADPSYRREILGEWVIETQARIYRYDPARNDIQAMPGPEFLRTASYGLGFDLGYHPDPTALVLACYNPAYDGYLYILQSEQHHKMVTQDLAARIRELDQIYRFQFIVGDSANLNVISDLNRTYGISTIKADKLGKFAHQAILNSDLIKGKIKLLRPGKGEDPTELLRNQLETVIWSRKALDLGKHIEDPRFNNHCTDALLYLHYYSRHYWYEPANDPLSRLKLTNKEHVEELTRKLIEANHDQYWNIDFAEPNK